MIFQPETVIHLCATPLEPDGTNTLTFSSLSAQQEYFESCIVESFTEFTFQRKDGIIRVNKNIEELYNVNYVMYQNSNFTNKWFYAYIINMQWASDATTFIKIETDTYQTWMFDITIKECFVEREHTNNDTVGANILGEPIPASYYKDIASYDCNSDFINYWTIVVGCTVNPKTRKKDSGGTTIDGRFTGVNYYGWSSGEASDLYTTLADLSEDTSVSNTVTSIFMLPRAITGNASGGSRIISSVNNYPALVLTPSQTYLSLDGYVPRNKKLYTGQFYRLKCTNNSGVERIYYLERFQSPGNVMFNAYMGIAPGSNAILAPQNYDKVSGNNFDEAIKTANYPLCEWSYDAYAEWQQTQGNVNAFNTIYGVIDNVVGGIKSVAGGDITGAGTAAIGISKTIASSLLSDDIAQYYPYQKQGIATNATLASVAINGVPHSKYAITAIVQSIPYNFARMADNFLDMFGYNTSLHKVPNITGRQNWNYVKTIGANIYGDIPGEDVEDIRARFDRGITFWHNPDTFGDYSQPNGITGGGA